MVMFGKENEQNLPDRGSLIWKARFSHLFPEEI